jgi:hypothetical protein
MTAEMTDLNPWRLPRYITLRKNGCKCIQYESKDGLQATRSGIPKSLQNDDTFVSLTESGEIYIYLTDIQILL